MVNHIIEVYGLKGAYYLSPPVSGQPHAGVFTLESRPYSNPASTELTAYLNSLSVRIDKSVFHDLIKLAAKYNKSTVLVEKAVDVMLAVDIAVMAERNEYDTAYLLSADGDFTPAVEAAIANSKKVFAASCNTSGQLGKVCSSFIHLKPDWFSDCY